MGKNKSAQPDKAIKSSKDAQVKSLSSVKQGAVTKPSQTPKSKSKEMAKQVAVKAEKVEKKSKKAKKEPTPVPESDSDSVEGKDEETSSGTSASSDDEAPAPKQVANANGAKVNGDAKKVAEVKDDSSDSSDSSSDDEAPAPKSAPAVASKAGATAKAESESDEGSGSSSEEESDEDEAVGSLDTNALNGKLQKVASKEASDEEESDSEGSSSEGSDVSSSEEESEEEAAPPPKKRKAEAETAPVSKKAKTDPGNDDNAKKNLFIGHLSYNIDEEWLTREFEEYGELSRVKVVLDRESGQSRGFGYVEYVNAEDGVKAQEAMHDKEIDGRAVNVDFSKPKDAGAPREDRKKSYGDNTSPASETIFVANLPFEITEDAVSEEFSKHGTVLGVRLPTDMETGNPKGFGYVQFGSVEESQEVFGKMTGAVIMGRPVRLDYSTPRPPRNGDSPGGRGGGRGGRGGFDRGGRGGGRGRGGFDRGGGRGRGGFDRGGRGGSTNRGGFGDFKGQKKTF